MRSDVGRHVFGAAAIASGVVVLVWHGYRDWTAAAQIVGGMAIQFRRTATIGALVLGATYLALAAVCVPRIVAAPRVYNSWGNFFEPFSLLTGAAIVAARSSRARAPQTLARTGRILFGICVVSFALEQAVYLAPTAALVPAWIPPSQTFWAITTTVLFALAAAALLANRAALLASRLLTAMLVLFGLLVWVPIVASSPHTHGNWSELTETFAIAGAAWILADLLAGPRSRA